MITLTDINNAIALAITAQNYTELNRLAELLKQLPQPAATTFSHTKDY